MRALGFEECVFDARIRERFRKGFRAPVIESSRSASAVEIVEPGWGSR
jgi:hypothetical protein